MVQSTKRVKQLNTPHHRLGCWRVEEVEADEVVDSERLEEKNDSREVGSLNLGDGVGFELVVERPFGVETEALTGSDSSCSTCSLVGCCSRALEKRGRGERGEHEKRNDKRRRREGRRRGGSTHRNDGERSHSCLRVVRVLLDESRVDNVNDSLDGDGCLSDVGSENDLKKTMIENHQSRRRRSRMRNEDDEDSPS